MDFSDEIVRVNCRVIPPQTIQQGGSYQSQDGDWSKKIQRGFQITRNISKFGELIINVFITSSMMHT